MSVFWRVAHPVMLAVTVATFPLSRTLLACLALLAVVAVIGVVLTARSHAAPPGDAPPPADGRGDGHKESSTTQPAARTTASRPADVLAFSAVDRDTKAPLAGAALTIRMDRELLHRQADAHGRYSLELPDPLPHQFFIAVRQPGYVPRRVSWWNGVGVADSYTLGLEKATPIGGIVQDELGRPIQGVQIELSSLEPYEGESIHIRDTVAETDGTGRWSCSVIPADPGDFSVRAEHPNYVSREEIGWEQSPIEKLRDHSAVLVLRPALMIGGQVVDPTGKPVANATVGEEEWWVPYNPPKRSDVTNAQGQFQLKGFRSGPLLLAAQAAGFAPQTKEVSVRDGMQPLVFELKPGKTIRGRVVDKTARPLAGARVAAGSWQGHATIHREMKTDAQGRFIWTDAPPEEVTFSVWKEGFRAIEIELSPSQKEHVITLPTALHVHGKVIDATNSHPVAELTIVPGIDWGHDQMIYWDRMNPRIGRDGRYEITFEASYPGHVVRIEADGYRPGISPVFADDEEEGNVVHDFRLYPTQAVLPPEAGLYGRVHLTDGTPVAGAEVLPASRSKLWYVNGDSQGRGADIGKIVTDSAGRFVIPSPGDLEAVFVAHEKGYAWATAKELAQDPEIRIRPWGRIGGTIHTSSRPASKDDVGLQYRFPFRPNTASLPWDTEPTLTGPGRFVFNRVPAGEVMACRLIDKGGKTRVYTNHTPLTVESGDVAQVEIGEESGGGNEPPGE